jgi:hypothetical protein
MLEREGQDDSEWNFCRLTNYFERFLRESLSISFQTGYSGKSVADH